MKSDLSFLKSGVPAKLQVDALMEVGRQYAAHFFDHGNPAMQSSSLILLLPAGNHHVERGRAQWE
jgi:hypothetical protein